MTRPRFLRLAVLYMAGVIPLVDDPATAQAANETSDLVDMCSNVLRYASSTTSLQRSQTMVKQAGNSMCQSRFSNESTFRSSASSIGLDYDDALTMFGLSSADASNDGAFKEARSSHCDSKNTFSFSTDQINQFEQQFGDIAYDTHKYCVSQLPSIIGAMSKGNIYLTAYASETKVDLRIQAFNQTQIWAIKAISSADSMACYSNKDPVQFPIKYENPVASIILTCDRLRPTEFEVSVLTDQHISNSIIIPGMDDALSDVQDENKRLAGLLAKLEKDFSTAQLDFNKKMESVRAELSKANSVISKLSVFQGNVQAMMKENPEWKKHDLRPGIANDCLNAGDKCQSGHLNPRTVSCAEKDYVHGVDVVFKENLIQGINLICKPLLYVTK